ncbi:MAG TPA: 4a-hydroxytetrahydrobiopterin dehydratase [Sunxiuqinia sp.]|nr:4a-hydroxytetrahydrobiopterin dehydratase [Sunxiuqinia sp.]
MKELNALKCEACQIGAPQATEEEIKTWKPQIPDWELIETAGVRMLRRTYTFNNFQKALDFTNQVGQIAEEEDHHPSILTEWGKVTVTWWTHKIKGLHRNDFIMASKTDTLL